MKKIFFLMALIGAFCISGIFPAYGQLSYEGSSSIRDALFPDLAKAYEKKTGIAFSSIKSGDSEGGFASVKSGKASIGGLSRLLTADEMAADLGNRVIGYDAIVIYLNKDNPVKNLSVEQLKKIFLKEITNWKDLGGADLPIETVLKTGGGTGGVMKQFSEFILEGKPLAEPGKSFASHKEDVEYVAKTPGAITFASFAFDTKVTPFISIDGVLPSKETLGRGEYALARPFVLVFNNKPEDPKVVAFMDWVLSEEGQKIVKNFVVPVLVSE